MNRLLLLAGTTILLVVAGKAQTKGVDFEVASIRMNKTTATFRGGSCRGRDSRYSPGAPIVPPLGRCVFRNVTAVDLIGSAYDLGWNLNNIALLLRGGPPWIHKDRFDVEAKATDANISKSELLAMLQKLLKERFALRVHGQDQEVPGFALIVATNGPHLVASNASQSRLLVGDVDRIEARSATLTELVEFLSNRPTVGGPVVDKTGLTGNYDFTLKFAPELRADTDQTTADGPTVFRALETQLGLKLKSERVLIHTIVIDDIKRPSEN